MNYSTIDFAGLQLDVFLVEGESYVTLSSLASGLGIHRQSVKDWGKNHNKVAGINVKVGRRCNVPATAYPVSVAGDFLSYRSLQGDQQADALLRGTFVADLKRSVKEAFGIQVTAAQHEERRLSERERILKGFILAKLGLVEGQTEEERNEVLTTKLTNEEYQVYVQVNNAILPELDMYCRGILYHDNYAELRKAKRQELTQQALQSVHLA